MIHILPFEERGRLDAIALPREPLADFEELLARCPHWFLRDGRTALGAVLRHLGLQPGDEVLVTNSSGQTYVSSCVTCTVFNVCKPSRVLTEATKAILIIHEYGWPHPKTMEWVDTARSRGIAVIEDCAHTLDSALNEVAVGRMGDYAFYSLSKVLPVRHGGILVQHGPEPLGPGPSTFSVSEEVEDELRRNLPWAGYYSRRRRENFDALAERLDPAKLLFRRTRGVTPFMLGIRTRRAPDIRSACRCIEWGATLEPDLLLVPTNPLVPASELADAVSRAMGEGCPCGRIGS